MADYAFNRLKGFSTMRVTWAACLVISVTPVSWQGARADDQAVSVWLSSSDLTHRFSQLEASTVETYDTRRNDVDDAPVVRVDNEKTHQTILGLGSSLEHTTCYNLSRLPDPVKRETIRNLVHPSTGIGMNLMRICIGTPDFTGEPWYSYCDTPDPDLTDFSIENDLDYVIPVLNIALEENPELRFYASPWSPPGWMTTTGDMIGGRLKREYYSAYARYFVRFVEAYHDEGIPIYAITVQNEPGVDRSKETDPKWKYPSCRWRAEEERDFIRDHLGPALAEAGLETRIWTYDHNFNLKPTVDGDDPGIDYPTVVLRDSAAARFVDGVAFHGYAGTPRGMATFADRFPGMPIYFTEGSTFGTRGALKIIDYFNHGASSYNAWVTMIDERGGPNNGPFEASRTCITLDSTGPTVQYHFDYYMYGHFMKFIQRGAKRLGTSSQSGARSAAAFRNPDGSIVAMVVNPAKRKQPIRVETTSSGAAFSLEPDAIATVVFPTNS
jgi:glucosylceramidase